jgi:hypothetical protein
VLAHAEIIVGAPYRNLARAICREIICDWKGPAAALQIRENAISAFSMKGREPLLEQSLKIHVGVLHVIPHYYEPCESSSQWLDKSRMIGSQHSMQSWQKFSAVIRPSGRAQSPRL